MIHQLEAKPKHFYAIRDAIKPVDLLMDDEGYQNNDYLRLTIEESGKCLLIQRRIIAISHEASKPGCCKIQHW